MTNNDKELIWNLIEKYDRVNSEFSDSLSRVLRGIETSKDYEVILSNYRTMEEADEMTVDSIVGDKMMFEIL